MYFAVPDDNANQHIHAEMRLYHAERLSHQKAVTVDTHFEHYGIVPEERLRLHRARKPYLPCDLQSGIPFRIYYGVYLEFILQIGVFLKKLIIIEARRSVARSAFFGDRANHDVHLVRGRQCDNDIRQIRPGLQKNAA